MFAVSSNDFIVTKFVVRWSFIGSQICVYNLFVFQALTLFLKIYENQDCEPNNSRQYLKKGVRTLWGTCNQISSVSFLIET